MASVEKMTIVVLYDDEVRIAAKATKRVIDLINASATDDDLGAAVRSMVDACSVALHGAEDDKATVMLGAKPAGRRRTK